MTTETTQAPVTEPVTPPVDDTTKVADDSNTGTRITDVQTEPVLDTTETIKETEPVTSKESLNKVQDFLTDAGLKPSDIAKEFTTNNGELSIASMKKLVDKHGEAVASLIVGQLKGIHKENVAKAEARDKAIFGQIEEAFKGVTEQTGSETWNELAGWAKTNMAKEERSEMNKMLEQGGLAAKLAVDYLVSTFKSSDAFQQPAELLESDNTAKDFGVRPLTKAEYTKELNVLLAKGEDYNTSPNVRALQARRQRGIERGM